uniref:Tudor domain-containing protein n=1 Tax=Tetraodon nigroviridis TaxID=99883 RepID=H3DPS0_TETNG
MAAAGAGVEVTHVDEGKTEVVPVGRIRPLHEKFLRMPVVTYPCGLDGVKESETGWRKEQIDSLKALILRRDVLATFSRHVTPAGAYGVVLYANDAACLNRCFLEKASSAADPKASRESFPPFFLGMKVQEAPTNTGKRPPRNDAAVSNGSDSSHVQNGADSLLHLNRHSAVFLTEETAASEGVFAVGRSIGVKVTYVENPNKFWCQSTEKSSSLRRLMQNLQSHYAFGHPQPIVESVCVARSPDDGMWYRARIMAGPRSPVVDVRLVDYGAVQKVPLRDVRPIDPAFLRLSAQAFPCCILGGRSPSDPAATAGSPAASRKLDDPNAELRCVVKAVTVDEEGLLLNVVDIETPPDGAGKLGALNRVKEEGNGVQFAPGDGYDDSTPDIEAGGKETVSVTSCRSLSHFYCNLQKNAPLFSKLNESIQQLVAQDRCKRGVFGPDRLCVAKHPDGRWCRGLAVENCGRIQVHFVDYGDTLVVKESDICSFPPEAAFAKSVPPQAVLLGLFDVPEDAPEEVSAWFAARAVGRTFAMSVVAKGEKGKLMVELFDGSVNVNGLIREMTERMGRQASLGASRPADQSDQSPRGDQFRDIFVQEGEKTLEAERRRLLDDTAGDRGSFLEEQPSFQTSAYGRPDVSPEQTREVFASCIVGPFYFWCQFNSTQELNSISALARAAGQSQGDPRFSLGLDPGRPCLALFSDDNQWYRAQVTRRHGDRLRVVFIDYGNEADVEVTSARALPRALLQRPPQAFLCSLGGFDESGGSWDDGVYDDFYHLLVDKPLKLSVLKIGQHSETGLPQHLVQIECEGEDIHERMKKYWNPLSKQDFPEERPEEDTLTRDGQTREKSNPVVYKQAAFSRNRKEEVYASCMVGPCFFWCQYANTEDLVRISQLCQEAGQTPPDGPAEAALPGAPCLALFSADSRWYRAQVMDGRGATVRVVFVDYGNEADVDAECVRPLPAALLAAAPQAFLCCLNGFEESKDSWRDDVCEDFYSLLVNKPLRATVLDTKTHPEVGIPQHTVQVELKDDVISGWLDVSTLMEGRCRQKARLAPGTQIRDTETVRVLIEHGARPCLKTVHGWTPAHYAAEFGRLAVLRLLHSLHAPVDKQDPCGDKPVRIAEVYGHEDCVAFLRRAEVESQAYRKVAAEKGISLDDSDEEWPEISKENEENRTSKPK